MMNTKLCWGVLSPGYIHVLEDEFHVPRVLIMRFGKLAWWSVVFPNGRKPSLTFTGSWQFARKVAKEMYYA